MADDRVISGPWTKCTFSSKDRAAACGFRRRPRIPLCTIIRPARASVTLPQSVCVTASSYSAARRKVQRRDLLGIPESIPGASVVSGRRVVAITDNAQYHRSRLHLEWRNQQAPQFGLDFLPPYSPDLNPIERIWKLTRRLCLHNRYFGLLDGVVAAVEDRVRRLDQTQRCLSPIMRNYLRRCV